MKAFDELMRDHDPATNLAELSDDRRTAILNRATTADAPPQRPSRRRRAWWVVGGAAAAGIGLLLGGVGHVPSVPPATAEAKEVLTRAAIQATDPPARPDQYWKLEIEGTEAERTSEMLIKLRQHHVSYIPVDGERPAFYLRGESVAVGRFDVKNGDFKKEDVPPEYREARDPKKCRTEGALNAISATWSNPTPAWAAGLPRDQKALREKLYADVANNYQAEGSRPHYDTFAFDYASSALLSGLLPADLRASLFYILQEIPGTKVIDRGVEMNGRTGVGIGRKIRGGPGPRFDRTEEVVVDPETGELIGYREHGEYPGDSPKFENIQMIRPITYRRTVVDEVPRDVQAAAKPVISGHTTC